MAEEPNPDDLEVADELIAERRAEAPGETPEDMTAQITPWIKGGIVNVLGGCCGTTPDHIASIAQAADGETPRVPVAPGATLRLSGLEPFQIAV